MLEIHVLTSHWKSVCAGKAVWSIKTGFPLLYFSFIQCPGSLAWRKHLGKDSPCPQTVYSQNQHSRERAGGETEDRGAGLSSETILGS